MIHKLRWILLCMLVTISALALPLRVSHSQSAAQQPGAAAPGREPGQPEAYAAVLAPKARVVLSAQVAGVVLDLPRELGQPFAKGELLVKLERKVFLADYHRAKAEMDLAALRLEVTEQLFREKSASREQLEQARTLATVKTYDWKEADGRLRKCRLQAPFAGRVVRCFVQQHEYVQPGQQLLEILDDRVLYAQFFAPADQRGRIRLGDKVSLHLQEQGRVVTATVSHLDPVVDPASSTFLVKAALDNAAGELCAGLRGSVLPGREQAEGP